MKQLLFIVVSLLMGSLATSAQRAQTPCAAVYTDADSLTIVSLLTQPIEGNDIIHYARRFMGTRYVGGTLDRHDPERLVVNLSELDCATFVETVYALAMTRRAGQTRFADYCRNLASLRYRGGRCGGYLSRLHYFTWWWHDNVRRGNLRPVSDPALCTDSLRVDNFYMSRNATRYALLRRHPEWADSIAALERAENGPDGTYLPAAATGLSREQLSFIRNGDLIAIVTKRAGLDYSHLGLAYWAKDGRLHMIHASSLQRRVVTDRTDLFTYLGQQRSAVGIRVFRLSAGKD